MITFYRQHLQEIKPSTNGWHTARCPFHEDNRASFTFEEKTGNWRCHASCGKGTVKEFAKRLNVTPPANGRGRIVATYDYVDEDGKLLYQSCRYEPKDFRQRRPNGKGWLWNLRGVSPVPYNLPAVLKSDTVYIVEGEKDCASLQNIGLTASCNSGGAGKWTPELTPYFKNKAVVILPDNDAPGRRHAEQVATALQGVAASVKVVHLPGLPEKGDVTDWLVAGGILEELQRLVNDAEPEPAESIKETLIISPTADWLLIEPPPEEFIFDPILSKGILGEIHGTSGIGKSSANNSLVFSMATGWELWGIFKPVRPFKVLYMPAEDSADIVRRRMYALAGALTPDERAEVQHALDNKLILIAGQSLPLLELRDGNPVESEGFGELMALVNKHDPDVLILDPKSMFYGSLDENNNAHCTAFISCLKKFSGLGVTVLFTHHESKHLGGQGSQFSSRGGQALSDGVRWQVSLSRMTPTEAEACGVDARDYVKVEQTKSNYTKFFEPFFLKRGEGGALDRADLQGLKRNRVFEAVKTVVNSGVTCQQRDIDKKDGKEFRAMVKELSGATIKDLKEIISIGLKNGILSKDENGCLCAA